VEKNGFLGQRIVQTDKRHRARAWFARTLTGQLLALVKKRKKVLNKGHSEAVHSAKTALENNESTQEQKLKGKTLGGNQEPKKKLRKRQGDDCVGANR